MPKQNSFEPQSNTSPVQSEKHLKQCYRLLWIIKGHINMSEADVLAAYEGYFKRVWYNEESWVSEEGFEEAWEEYQLKEIEKDACRGGRFD